MGQCESREADLEESQARELSLENRIRELKVEKEALERELEKSSDRDQLEMELEKCGKKLADAEKKLRAAKEENAQLRKRLAEAEEGMAAEGETLKAENARKDSQLKAREKEFATLKAQEKDLELQLQHAEERLKALQASIEEEQQMEQKVKTEAGQKAKAIEEKEKELKSLRITLKDAQKQLEQAQERIQSLEDTKRQHQEEGTHLKAEMSKRDADSKGKDDQLQVTNQRANELKVKLDALTVQLEDKEKQLAAAKEELDAVKKREGEAQHQLANLKGVQAATAKELEAMKEKEYGMEREVSSVGHKLDDVGMAAQLSVEAALPLQQAIDAGDEIALGKAIVKLKPTMEAGEEKRKKTYGEFSAIVVPFYNTADRTYTAWQDILATIRATLKTCASSGKSMTRRQTKHVFQALKESSITGLSVEKSDPGLGEQLIHAIMQYHVEAGGVGNSLQEEILRRTVACNHFGEYDFTDMCSCLCFVDKEEKGENDFYLKRARALIDSHEVHEFRGVLSSLETILFFLRFLDKEDLALTYKRLQALQTDDWTQEYIKAVKKQYSPGNELVNTAGLNLLNEKDVLEVLEQLKDDGKGGTKSTLDNLRSIFYWWSHIMKEKYDLLVLPHHTQVTCLLACLLFIEGKDDKLPKAGALIAEMGTGEGKSGVIASLALYCSIFLGKKVHVVVDDESLLERDFRTYQDLFGRVAKACGRSDFQAKLCVSQTRKEMLFKHDDAVQARCEEEADITYCEAKHVQNFYTRLAKQGGTDFKKVYANRILVLDEVDALVIDESPNVPFVYDNAPLSAFAAKVCHQLCDHVPLPQILSGCTTAVERKVAKSMDKAMQVANNWKLGEDVSYDEKAQRYFRVQNGRINEGAWSLPLEFKNFAEHCTDTITYNERLFVMNRPRTFRQYSHIIGLSGSVGSEVERQFLKSIYDARFLKLPTFLMCCRDAVDHKAEPRGVEIEDDEISQWHTIVDAAFNARERTPVLIIAADRKKAGGLSDQLIKMADAKGLKGKDVVRSLSRDVYESNPDVFKENLFQCTQPVGKGASKSFRIAVTDPRGGRGTDYHVTDADADKNGGLMLIIATIPKNCRDWIQYLGRTARQDRHGQWMGVLNRKDYAADAEKYNDKLMPDSAVNTILGWADKETSVKIESVRDSYQRGLRVNELSEEVARLKILEKDAACREVMVKLCNDYDRMSIVQIDELASSLTGFNPAKIKTEAEDPGPDMTAITSVKAKGGGAKAGVSAAPKGIIIVFDRSSSMLTKDCGGKSRFDVCKDCIKNIYENNVEDHDKIGLYTFEDKLRESFEIQEKGPNKEKLADLIAKVPIPNGLTCFHDSVLECIYKLAESGMEKNFLIALTDGDDNMSEEQPNGEFVTQLIHEGIPNLNLIVITCGPKIKPKMIETIQYWTNTISATGEIGMYLPADKPEELGAAFDRVAELIDMAEGETDD